MEGQLEHYHWTIDGPSWHRMLGHMVESYPEEACGFLFCSEEKSLHIEETHPAKNITLEDPATRYEFDPLEFIEKDRWADQRRMDVCGFYHSHPNHPPVPSEYDRKMAWEGYLYLIISIKDGFYEKAGAWVYDPIKENFKEVMFRLNE